MTYWAMVAENGSQEHNIWLLTKLHFLTESSSQCFWMKKNERLKKNKLKTPQNTVIVQCHSKNITVHFFFR
jgi:hypothetical protein